MKGRQTNNVNIKQSCTKLKPIISYAQTDTQISDASVRPDNCNAIQQRDTGARSVCWIGNRLDNRRDQAPDCGVRAVDAVQSRCRAGLAKPKKPQLLFADARTDDVSDGILPRAPICDPATPTANSEVLRLRGERTVQFSQVRMSICKATSKLTDGFAVHRNVHD